MPELETEADIEKKQKRSKEYIGIHEAADVLGVSHFFVRDNVVPNVAHVRIGRKTLMREEAFRKYLKGLERGRNVQ